MYNISLYHIFKLKYNFFHMHYKCLFKPYIIYPISHTYIAYPISNPFTGYTSSMVKIYDIMNMTC